MSILFYSIPFCIEKLAHVLVFLDSILSKKHSVIPNVVNTIP